jgi:hypothetical protein
VFVKEADIVLSNDVWYIALDINIEACHDTISAIRSDLLTVAQHKRDLTPISELLHMETLLQQSEDKLTGFHKILSRTDRKR